MKLVLALPMVLSSFLLNAQEKSYLGDITDHHVIRRVEQHPQAWRIWQPFIVQGQTEGDLIVAYGAMRHGKKDMGDIFVTLSQNDGESWSEPVAVFDHTVRQRNIQFAYANPVLFRGHGQQVVWCYAMRCSIAQRNSEESHLVGAFSADWGRTWTSVEMAMQYTGPLILNAGIVETEIHGSRRFLLPAHRNTLASDPRGSREHFLLSSSSLLEWKLEAYIPQATPKRVFLHEGNLGVGKRAGELKIVMRTAQYEDSDKTTDPPRAYSSVSFDGGHTWSLAQPEPELHNAKAKGFFSHTMNGRYIYVYNDGPAQRDKVPGFPNGGRTSLRYKVQSSGGSWSDQKTFYDAGIKNSYPTLVEVAPNDFRCVWDSGTEKRSRTHISFGKLKIDP